MAPPTPSHLAPFSSPAPRSVLSPAITGSNARPPQQAGKSPYVGTPAGKRALELNQGSQTTTVPSQTTPAASQSVPTSQPIHPSMSALANIGSLTGLAGSSPAMMNFDSPAALGLSLGDLDSGVGMGISMSSLGLPMGARGDDEDRRRRLEDVLDILSKRPGWVSEEGVERLASRCGLEVSWSLLADERKLGIAGLTTFLADLYFQANAVERVELEFATESEEVTKHAGKAAKILHRDLSPAQVSASAYTSLQRFADNLQRLARMDKLSTADVNCFDAIAGVYANLKTLFDHEKQLAMTVLDAKSTDLDRRAEQFVTCKKSGKPAMHAGQRLGLAVTYWVGKRNISNATTSCISLRSPAAIEGSMDTDDGEPATESEEVDALSLIVECESCPAELYPPLRISSEWLALRTEKHPDEAAAQGHPSSLKESAGPTYEWLDPPSTYQSITEEVRPDVLPSNGSTATRKLPNVRFVARFEPPVVLPLNVAEQICNSVGITTSAEMLKPTTFDGLLLRRGPTKTVNGATEFAVVGKTQVETRKTVWTRKENGGAEEHIHDNSLFVAKAEYARELAELPFEHPGQILAILAVLRQYAFLARLLQSTFAPGQGTVSAESVEFGSQSNGRFQSSTSTHNGSLRTADAEEDLAAFLSDERSEDGPLSVDLTLAVVPSPHLTVVFPLKSGASANITLAILPNADVTISGQNLIDAPGDSSTQNGGGAGTGGAEDGVGHQADEVEKYQRRVEALAKGLMICEDLNVWIEWIRQKFG